MPDRTMIFRAWPIRQTLAAVLLAVVGLNVFAVLLIHKRIIEPGFVDLERQEAQEASERCVKVLKQETEHLRVFAEDWSSWDDTYRFVVDSNEAYISTNLGLATFRNAQMNLLYFYNAAGELVCGEGCVPNVADAEAEPDTALGSEVAQATARIRQKQGENPVAGIVLFGAWSAVGRRDAHSYERR